MQNYSGGDSVPFLLLPPALLRKQVGVGGGVWEGGVVGQVVGRSKRNDADAGSIPRRGTGVFSQSQLSVQTLLRCPYTPVCH